MRAIVLVCVAMTIVSPLAGDDRTVLRIRPSSDRAGLDLTLRSAPIEEALRNLEIHLARRLALGVGIETKVDYEASGVAPEHALREIVRAAGLALDEFDLEWVVRDPAEKRVSVDVVEEDARSIVRSIASQCGVRNLVIEPGLSGSGTFRFRDVPCSAAIDTVLRSLGLTGRIEPNSVLVVGR